MRSRRSPVCIVLAAFLLLGLIALPRCSPAQQTVTLGNATAALTGPWKFHIGDSPQAAGTSGMAWAQPEFDDPAWERWI